jgi:hypothetical protein
MDAGNPHVQFDEREVETEHGVQQFPLIPKSAIIGGFCVTFSRCRMMNRRIFSVREVVTMVTLDSE